MRKDGERFWANVTITALYDEAGELQGFAKVTRDMTERRAREEALERERQRAEAEKQRAEERNALLELMQEVAVTANEADSLGEAMQKSVEAICTRIGWPVGHVYQLSSNGEPHVVPTGIWHLEDEARFQRFRAVTEKVAFAVGVSLPGRAAERGAPVWIRDVSEDPEFVRAQLAEELGVRGAFGVPVRYEGETIAVLEFFSTEAEEPAEQLLEAMDSVGVQLSRVAEREAAREVLEESEARFRALAEESPTGITVIQDGVFKYVNNRYAEIFGYERDEMIEAFPVEEVVHPDDREIVRENLRRRIEGEVDAVQFQARGLTKEGDTLELEVKGRRFTYQGRPAVIGSVLDVTERKEAAEALRRSERRYRRLFEESRDAIVLTTPEGKLLDANTAAEELFGYARGELLELDARQLYARPEERKERIVPALDEVSGSVVLEAEMRHKSGRTFLASASVTVHRGEEGEPELIQALVRDITGRRRLQREVLRVQEEERRRLGQDLHDGVASQLTGIGLMLAATVRRDVDSEVKRSIQEVQALVEESCQEIRRLSRGLAPAGLSEGELSGVLERLASNVETGRFETEGELPTLENDAAAHLYWIAQEAATNARKYAEAERITIRLKSEGEALALEVEDDGRGFDPDAVEKDSLGLRTMRYRAELLGGRLTINTAPGEGTRVACHVPVQALRPPQDDS